MSGVPNGRRKAQPASRIRVLIADDHVTVREGLAAIIGRQADMSVAGEAATGREAIELWQKCSPDVMLIDLRMPIMDGVTAIGEICRMNSAARDRKRTPLNSSHTVFSYVIFCL